MQLSGELSKVSLPNLLQLVRNGELTGKIALLQGTKTATVFVDGGNIVHVESDMWQGRDALMELFLWLSGSFSFMEEDLGSIPRTLQPFTAEDALQKLIRDGLAYLEQKQYLDQLRISGQSVLAPTERVNQPAAWQQIPTGAALASAEQILLNLDGRLPLADTLRGVSLSRRAFVQGVYWLLHEELVQVVQSLTEPDSDKVNLPAWVVARLKQDNPDISQAIVDMVIWVDRVKCWMYQVDVDFMRIIDEVEESAASEDGEVREPSRQSGGYNDAWMSNLGSLTGGEYFAATTAPPPDDLPISGSETAATQRKPAEEGQAKVQQTQKEQTSNPWSVEF